MSKPLVGIIMGSDSDLPIMKESAKILEELGVEHEITIVSAHRTPDRMVNYAKSAKERGIKVIIAGAGGSAHLPGMTAANCIIPVIGVPIHTRTLSGVDSLYSIVQMPKGISVACMAINGAINAGILAAQILALNDDAIYNKLVQYRNQWEIIVTDKAEKLEEQGFSSYLDIDTLSLI